MACACAGLGFEQLHAEVCKSHHARASGAKKHRQAHAQAWREQARGARTRVALLIHVDDSNLRDVKKEPRNSRRVEKMTERELRIIISILMEIRIHVDVNLRVALGLIIRRIIQADTMSWVGVSATT